MPTILDPNSAGAKVGPTMARPLETIDHGYEYPEDMNLRPGFEKHDRLVQRVMTYARDSYDRLSRRHSDWREIDKVLKAYTHVPSLGGPVAKRGRDEKGEPAEVVRRIVMPVSYVVLETLLTYFSAAFFQRPVFTYEGSGPEDILGSMLLTEVIEKHVHRNGVRMALHTAWRDMFAYGVGYATPIWHQEMGRRMEKRPLGTLTEEGFVPNGQFAADVGEYQVIYEGNKLINIDPYLALPDPNVAAHEVQEGEFFGWMDEGSLNKWLREETNPQNGYFNVKYLKEFQGTLSSTIRNRGERSKRADHPPQTTEPVDVIWMYIDLIPNDWDLGSGKLPETWLFGVAADKILIKAEPLNLIHGKIPVVAGAPDTDGYTSTPVSRLFVIEEIQSLVDFLYTSHVEDIKRHLNDSIVYDPTLINTRDLNDNRSGKRIRLRKRAWGRGGIKDNAIFQLDVRDVTQQNVEEALFLVQQAKSATSTMDSLQGTLAPRTSRVSASEARDTRLSGLSRLERPAQLISEQFMLPIARMFASNTQQFMSEEVFIKTVGDLEMRLREDFGMAPAPQGRLKVNPLDLIVEYDVSAHDGAIPGKEDPQVWTELFQVLLQTPEVAQGFDIFRIFKHIARQMGASNVDEFVRRPPTPEVLPDEQVLQGVQAGNLAPLGGDGL